MLDIQKIRNNPEEVKEALKKRLVDVDFTELLEWDKKRRNLISESEELKAKKNKVSADIPRLIKNSQNVDDLKVEMKEIADRIKVMDDELRAVEADIKSFLSGLPNIPAEDVVA